MLSSRRFSPVGRPSSSFNIAWDASIKKRLLSGVTGVGKNIAMLDNIKTMRFSSADLEALLTAKRIDGHKMYVGSASIPNHYMYVLTINGAEVSQDVASRTVSIRLSRPSKKTRKGAWEQRVRKYIEKYRMHIVADAFAILGSTIQPGADSTSHRFQSWYLATVAKSPHWKQILDHIHARAEEMDGDAHEGQELADYVRQAVLGIQHDPDDAVDYDNDEIRLTPAAAAYLYNQCFGDNVTPKKAGHTLKRLQWDYQQYRSCGKRYWVKEGDPARSRTVGVRERYSAPGMVLEFV